MTALRSGCGCIVPDAHRIELCCERRCRPQEPCNLSTGAEIQLSKAVTSLHWRVNCRCCRRRRSCWVGYYGSVSLLSSLSSSAIR